MILLTKHYPNTEAVEKADEPYKSVAIILDKQFLAGSNGIKPLSRRDFLVSLALSCIRTIAEHLTNHPVTIYNNMLRYWENLMNTNKIFTNDFDKYSVPYDKYRATIFGGVYYVLTVQNIVEEEVLRTMDNLVQENAEVYPYFKVFKDSLPQKQPQSYEGNLRIEEQIVTPEEFIYGDVVNAEGGSSTCEQNETTLSEIKAKYEAKLKEKDDAIEEMRKKIEEKDEKGGQSIKEESEESSELPLGILRNKVKFEFFIRLLEESGLDFHNANKTEIGNLWHALTEKSADDCRKYCSERKYLNSHTKQDVENLNKQLVQLGITVFQL